MKESVVHFLKRHHIQFKGRNILIGVSGGPDSIALLHMLSNYVKNEDAYIEAIIVNHQLREEAKKDIEYVREMCENVNVPVSSDVVDVYKYSKNKKVSIQVAARELRYKAFERKMREIKADYLVLGHHGDDQIETLIMNMARAANSSSLVGIPFQRPFSGGMIIRPLLSVSKAEINAYCDKYQLNPQIDASNEDTSYTRNDIRKNVIPKLRERNSLLHLTGQYLNETLMEDELFMVTKAKKAFEKLMFLNGKENIVKMDVRELKKYERPLQRRIYRLTLDYLYEEILPNSLSYKHEESFLQLINSEQNKVIDFPRYLRLEKSYSQLLFYFAKKKNDVGFFQKEIQEIPAEITLPNGDQLMVSYSEDLLNENKFSFILPFKSNVFSFIVRQRQAGDKMKYRGLQGTKKIKDILIDEKIPRREREHIYVLVGANNEILWLIGLRKSMVQFDSEDKSYISFTYKLKNKL